MMVAVRDIRSILRGLFWGSARHTQGKIFISGTGRAGTTMLIRLLTELGCDTGFSVTDLGSPATSTGELIYFKKARAGFEKDIFAKDGPRIVKSPFLCDHVDEVLKSGIQIARVVIPIRDFDAAAKSREFVQWETTGAPDGKGVPGGLWDTERASDQQTVLKSKLANLIEACVRNDIEMVFLAFPRLVRDHAYLFERLRFILPSSVNAEEFGAVFKRIVDPSLVHDFSVQPKN